jgi:putative transposase
MPRRPRPYQPGMPCHVIQRGNNHNPTFFDTADCREYLRWLGDACDRHRVALHAYVLMTNHVHLLMTPEDRTGISKVVQSVGRRYVQYVNKRFCRSGTLWEGRHRASLICDESYLLTCMRYIEMNPVRASMARRPGEYLWSSFRGNADGEPDPLLSPHPVYQGLGRNRDDRCRAYRELFAEDIDDVQLYLIRSAVNFSLPLGNDRFRKDIERALAMQSRRIVPKFRPKARSPGRPRGRSRAMTSG